MSSVDLGKIKDKTKEVHSKHKDRRKEKRKKRKEKRQKNRQKEIREQKKKQRQHVIGILKINGLSLAAFPVLCLATIAKMLAAALRQFLYLLAVAGVVFSVTLAFRILQNPQEYIEGAASVLASLFLGGIFSLIFLKLIQKFAKRLKKFAEWLQKRLDGMFEYFYQNYLRLIKRARQEIGKLGCTGNTLKDRLQLSIFWGVRGLNRGIVVFVTKAFYVFAVLLGIQILLSIVTMSMKIQNVFGISLQAYLKLFPTYELVYGGCLLLVKKAGILLLFALMGKEWKTWGEELKDNAKDERKENEDAIQGGKVAALEGILVGGGTDDEKDKANEAKDILQAHLNDFEEFQKKVAQTAQTSSNYILRARYTEYVAVLKEVTEKIASFDIEIPVTEYAAVNDQAKKLDGLKKEIESLFDITHTVIQPIPKAQPHKEGGKTDHGPGFFHGCDTEEKLDKRFQALLQIFDADSEAADEFTLEYINQQYKKKKQKFSKSAE
ncbi:MAG: hypothetical protein ACI4HI_05285 [Lachnospiraceae bacterium]